ncbi:MAG: TetR/AcrR family transcriptional regulator [Burkholderiales bacterium]|nr:TetR/AcrR family transcriptional regulator [Burkholderiales bacterium]
MSALPIKVSKGEETRALILEAAVQHAGVHGFDALTIGGLAEKTGLSKSGLFAHFGSKEELQIATLDEAVRRYNEVAFIPALKAPRGLRRLSMIFDNWLQWIERSGLKACPMIAANTEFDDRPGPMRDAVIQHMQRLNHEIMRGVQMAIDTGEFADDADPEQFAFELFGIISSCYRSRNLFQDSDANVRARKAFDRLTASNLAQPAVAKTSSSAPLRNRK